jgi:C-terminal processing protease CtpA/Prc
MAKSSEVAIFSSHNTSTANSRFRWNYHSSHTWVHTGLTLPSAIGGSISDSPKEVIDQVWQIVYRDYLDSSGDYDEENLGVNYVVNLLQKSFAGSAESYEAIRGMLASLNDPYTPFPGPETIQGDAN